MFELFKNRSVRSSLGSLRPIRILSVRARKPVRAELVEACGDELGDAQSPTASSEFVLLCPSTGSGRTDLFTDSVNYEKRAAHS